MTDLAERYGTHRPVRRVVTIGAAAAVVVALLAWLAWAAWFQGRPDVQSAQRNFAIAGQHTAKSTVEVKLRSTSIEASCVLRALAEDHSVVGELNFRVSGKDGEHQTFEKVMRTERRPTTVELIGCTTVDQVRPR